MSPRKQAATVRDAGAPPTPFKRTDLPRDTFELARFLIGARLCRLTPEGLTVGTIVETEAYPSGDPASHSFRGERPRCRSMFLDLGFAYVYQIYGTSYCLNVASDRPGVGAAVLLRAVEPEAGLGLMAARRGTTVVRDLARGPGRLAQAFGVDRLLDGIDLCRPGELWLAAGSPSGVAPEIIAGPRIGISKSADAPFRFVLAGNRYVSGPRS